MYYTNSQLKTDPYLTTISAIVGGNVKPAIAKGHIFSTASSNPFLTAAGSLREILVWASQLPMQTCRSHSGMVKYLGSWIKRTNTGRDVLRVEVSVLTKAAERR